MNALQSRERRLVNDLPSRERNPIICTLAEDYGNYAILLIWKSNGGWDKLRRTWRVPETAAKLGTMSGPVFNRNKPQRKL